MRWYHRHAAHLGSREGMIEYFVYGTNQKVKIKIPRRLLNAMKGFFPEIVFPFQKYFFGGGCQNNLICLPISLLSVSVLTLAAHQFCIAAYFHEPEFSA